ncbi:uncharacterized protein LOC121377413 [Gigantopelta aegis]|uniref:uncharacterized protein LOC121377413 n=1 Tax=Gigantopelta aegis TaxID=1735272 RepID=UPI001B88B245|nr:uncharacterized protein LOC121377413 [Gigantopelta aegis]
MLELMTWNEIVNSLTAEGKLKKAAIFDMNGEKLAGTTGVRILGLEARGIVKCLALSTPTNTIFALFVEDARYSCFVVDEDTLIGKTTSDIFVAHKSNNVLICGFSDVHSKVSCLSGVKNFARRIGGQVGPNVTVPTLI